MMRAIWRESRPKQWLKNVLVFAAPGAAGVLDDIDALVPTLGIFVALSLVASGTYFWNDIVDVEADRLHPTKRRRPIAAGEIPLPIARFVGTALVIVGLALAFTAGWRAGVAVAVYLAVTASYSMGLKRIAVVDLMVVASGFVIRAIAGAEAADVPMSTWFLLCTSFGSLFIVTGAGDPHGGDRCDTRVVLHLGLRDQGDLRPLVAVVRVVDRADGGSLDAVHPSSRAWGGECTRGHFLPGPDHPGDGSPLGRRLRRRCVRELKYDPR